MQRPPRPEPTRISPYFFEQLQQALQHRDGDDDNQHAEGGDALRCQGAQRGAAAAEEEAHTTAPMSAVVPPHASNLEGLFATDHAGPHRDGAGVPAPIFSAPQQRDLQQLLWTSFTPAHYTESCSRFVIAESGITGRLQGIVAEAWECVQRVIHRNRERRAHLEALTSEDAAWRDEVQSKLYWQSSDIVARYGLEVGGGDTVDGDSNANEHILLDFSVLPETQQGSATTRKSQGTDQAPDGDDDQGYAAEGAMEEGQQGPSTPAEVDGAVKDTTHPRAKAWTASTQDLLDPCGRPHPLRRIFAPLQRERDALPKWTTLLFQELLEIQRTQLPNLEQRLQRSVLFKVPLHRPFLEARAVLQACATQQRAAPDVEVGQVAAYRHVEQLAKRLTAFVKEQQSMMGENSLDADEADGSVPYSADSEADMHSCEELRDRWATAETLWTMLLTELDACTRFTKAAVPCCTELQGTITAEKGFVQGVLDKHRSSCEATLARMKAEARTCSELLIRNSQRTLAAVAEMEEKFNPDLERLKAAIARRKAELVHLEAQQEKNIRRVREALKACYVDQVKYEEASQALLQDQVSLAQLETSHQQLREAVRVRHEGAVDCKKHVVQLAQLLEDGDTAIRSLFAACEAHQRRMSDDDYYIQCRLVDQCTQALQQRCRCLHAMAAMYDERYATIERRAGGAWQLQFLLSGERDWAVANLTDVRAEFALLEAEWKTVQNMRETMDMDPAELDGLVRTAEWAELRAALLRLDAPRLLQRQLPTLRAHAEALAHPAAGCGSQAVRRLLTS
ncbi:hypothetical protein ABL78_3052 [Leptomonas seymouri]|uniref:Uncharacterized protein n=1 Tax=Leptomonas seymouri TaxID=5684 RepID=A0A0N1PDX8_LEPSE|nr:hypothetical protein ABL78_3052 [Leptomonas seymouri]|eukprot:KPI87825.1 hypothetical protein ABL78_3052 [Leptomonas seymouri]